MDTTAPAAPARNGTNTLAADRPPLVPPVQRWACCHCGAGGLDSGGGRCPYCDGTGHHP
ncbi:MAG: hypothetical protein JWL97_4120 [Gemmatimonadales bacterium]|nr:hypothetical protein [Gemmatimonadales bacterium]